MVAEGDTVVVSVEGMDAVAVDDCPDGETDSVCDTLTVCEVVGDVLLDFEVERVSEFE